MANAARIAAAGRSIEALLNDWFERQGDVAGKQVRASLCREGGLERLVEPPALTVYLYRVGFNPLPRRTREPEDAAHTADLDLHYLLTPWADSAEEEHQILGMVVDCLHQTPVLSGPLLHETGRWKPRETVPVTPEDISLEVWCGILSALPMGYRLSLAYVARLTSW